MLEPLVSWALSVQGMDFPPDVRRLGSRIFADSLGCAWGGALLSKGKAPLRLASGRPRRDGVTVPGLAHRVDPWYGSLAWGELINALEFDADLTPCHVSPYVVPTAWISAEEQRVSGRELLEALLVAHEVTARIAGELPGLRVLHGSSRRPRYSFRHRWGGYLAGIIGSVVADVRLRGGGLAEAKNALGVAATLCPAPMSSRFFLTARPVDAKYGPAGAVSLAARVATDLSFSGYRGDYSALFGENGLLPILGSGEKDLSAAARDLGRRWRVRDSVLKRYPTGGVGHVGLDLFRRFLSETGTPPEEIREVHLYSDPIVEVPVLSNPEVTTAVDAQFSLPWGFAALPFYPPGPAWQSAVALHDPRVRKLYGKVRMHADRSVVHSLYRQLVQEGRPYVHRRPTRLVVRSLHGRWEGTDDEADGYPDRPLPDRELEEKFQRNLEGRIAPREAGRLFRRLCSLEKERSVPVLGRHLRGLAEERA